MDSSPQGRSSSPPPSASPSPDPVSPSISTSSKPPIQPSTSSSSHHRRREYNLYDAVAGRITSNDPLYSYPSTHPRKSSSSPKPRRHSFSRQIPRLAPEDVLFRRKNAPTRYAENDIYWASEDLEGEGIKLPESELLVCLHSYVSRFYDALGAKENNRGQEEKRVVDERSMDETALLAMGVLLEEAGREVLGKGGERVFVEGEQLEDRDMGDIGERVKEADNKKGKKKESKSEGEKSEGERRRKSVKRRKLGGRKWEESEMDED
ncbi:hypothetical protein QBC43DRAFT_370626 [Cladorrhinum sp. PSN259]|nr:hypothetical protein QBC43DRAFT_370626 [Cladorrhinum sp. PSN259]